MHTHKVNGILLSIKKRSGESGSGKTEAAKSVISYLAFVSSHGS